MNDSREFAKGYAVGNDMQHDAGMFLIERLNIRPGMRVLDVGCGPGGLTLVIADLVGESGQVVGIDPSPERISLAAERSMRQLSFHEGQAEDLSRFPSSSFDVIFMNSTFHWVRDQPAALQEFARTLKFDGRLGISGGSGDFVGTHEKIIKDVTSRDPYREYPRTADARFLGRKELEHLLTGAGFDNRDILERTVIKASKGAEDMVQWLEMSSSGKIYGTLPPSLRPDARDDLKREWVKVMTDDGIKLEMRLLVTIASKMPQAS